MTNPTTDTPAADEAPESTTESPDEEQFPNAGSELGQSAPADDETTPIVGGPKAADDRSDEEPTDDDQADETDLEPEFPPAASSAHPKADEYLAAYEATGPTRPQYRAPAQEYAIPEPPPAAATPSPTGRWTRPEKGRLAAGVAVGIARRAGLPTWLVRAGFVFLTFTGFAGLAAYLAAWALMPKEGETRSAADGWRDEFDKIETTNGKIGIALIALAVGVFLVSTGVFVGPVVLAALIVAGVTMARSKTA